MRATSSPHPRVSLRNLLKRKFKPRVLNIRSERIREGNCADVAACQRILSNPLLLWHTPLSTLKPGKGPYQIVARVPSGFWTPNEVNPVALNCRN